MCDYSVLLTNDHSNGQGCEIVTKIKVDQGGSGLKSVQGFGIDVP